jgi:hypothetical protein
MPESPLFWKKCSACKKPIAFRALYYVCNVSTCNRQRTGLSFCSVECWDSHVPMMRHRESWAEERRAPAEGEQQTEAARKPRAPAQTPSVAPAASAAVAPPAPVRAILRKKP